MANILTLKYTLMMDWCCTISFLFPFWFSCMTILSIIKKKQNIFYLEIVIIFRCILFIRKRFSISQTQLDDKTFVRMKISRQQLIDLRICWSNMFVAARWNWIINIQLSLTSRHTKTIFNGFSKWTRYRRKWDVHSTVIFIW